MIIAIDGPAGVGKGEVSDLLAKKLNFYRLDTGDTYRALALAVIENNIKINETDKIVLLLKTLKIDINEFGEVFLNGRNVTNRLKDNDVNDIVSDISSIIEVRHILTELQRFLAKNKNVVTDGRDTTTQVFKDAKYKFYLDANMDTRVKRRYNQNIEHGINTTLDEVIDNISKRDYNDLHKKVGKLIQAEDAIYIDSSYMTKEEVVNKMLEYIGSEKL